MIGAVARKELVVLRRDGRVLALLGLIGALALLSLLTAWATHVKHEQQVRQAQADDAAAFRRQGDKPSHSAAHFGRMAYKPPAPLAVLDPGATPYLGQVIWLEAHRQDPAMFRPAEDAPELSRLADLSVAGILTTLLPLLVFVMGYGAFAAERERRTLPQVLTAGASPGILFAGKLVAVAGLGVCVSSIIVVVATSIALVTGEGGPAGDTVLRGIGLSIGFAAYACACAGTALLVSAVARTATAALLILLTLWAVGIVVIPRVAASAGELLDPAPDASTFWTATSDTIRANRPKQASDALRSIEKRVIGRAVGREPSADQAPPTNLNRVALGQEISEVLGAQVYAEAYAALYATYDRQRDTRRAAAVLSPAIALSHWSAALAGTDLAAHRHFALAAEQQRQQLIRRINEDMMVNGAGQGYDYLAAAEFWGTVPDFVYRAPSASFAIRSALVDLLLLLSWAGLAIAAAWQVARRQAAI
jgi:ABC-2 type transport system permease protein